MTGKPDWLPLTWSEPNPIKYFPVDHVDWLAIKRLIARMKEPFKYYESIGGIFGGAGLVCCYELYKGFSQGTIQGNWLLSTEGIFGLIFLILCAIFYFMANQQNEHACERIETVLIFCETVEDKTNDDFLKIDPPVTWTQRLGKMIAPPQKRPEYRKKLLPLHQDEASKKKDNC